MDSLFIDQDRDECMVMKIALSFRHGADFSVSEKSNQRNLPQFLDSGYFILYHRAECEMPCLAGKQQNRI
jgi:hypothetical protein